MSVLFTAIRRITNCFLLICIILYSFFLEGRSTEGIGSNFTLKFSLARNPFKYSTYYSDEESGNYYLKSRYYSPSLMRFISFDTYDLSNRYAYCDSNPISRVDPDGHMSDLGRNFMQFSLPLLMGAVGYMTGNPFLAAAGAGLGQYIAGGAGGGSSECIIQSLITTAAVGVVGAIDRLAILSKTMRDATGCAADVGINVGGNIGLTTAEGKQLDWANIGVMAGLSIAQPLLINLHASICPTW